MVEHPLRDRKVVGSNPGRAIPKALKMVPVATLLGAQHYNASTGFPSADKYYKTNFATITKIKKTLKKSPIIIHVCIHLRTVWMLAVLLNTLSTLNIEITIIIIIFRLWVDLDRSPMHLNGKHLMAKKLAGNAQINRRFLFMKQNLSQRLSVPTPVLFTRHCMRPLISNIIFAETANQSKPNFICSLNWKG